MPLVPFKLFNDETRLIVHNDCLYKLKLANKSNISSTEISSFQRDEMNTELTKVIRAILFLIKVEKIIPHKIHTPFFTVCITVKFWKIALKLGFSKDGSRLKCGHLIELMLYMKESRIREKEDSEASAESPLESNVENENVQGFGRMGLRQFVINSDDSDSESHDTTVCKSPEHSQSSANKGSNTISTNIDGATKSLVKGFRIPDSLHNQAKPPDQTHMISDQTAHAQINSDSLPLEETTPVQILSTFVSSCTQTDPDELDLYANNSDPHSENFTKATCYSVHSDHNYLKSPNSLPNQDESKLAVSNSNKESTQLQENDISNVNCKQSSVSKLNFSLLGDNVNEDSGTSDDDDDDDDVIFVSSNVKEVNCSVEFTVAVDKVKIKSLNAEPGGTCLGSLGNKSESDCPDQNDVWGIESRPLEVVSEVEIPMESRSESSRDESLGNSNHKPLHCSEETSNQFCEKTPVVHHNAEQAVEEGNPSDIQKTDSSVEKLKSGQCKKQVKPKSKKSRTAPRNRDRARSLRSHKKVENILDHKLRSARRPKKSMQRQASTSQKKKTPAKKAPEKKRLQSVDDTYKRSNQGSGIPQALTEISFGLHDRYKVQNQELQEDLKLQNLAHPSSSCTKRKQRSFLEYINFSNFLRRSKRHK